MWQDYNNYNSPQRFSVYICDARTYFHNFPSIIDKLIITDKRITL